MSRSPIEGRQEETIDAYRAGWRAVMRLVREGFSWSGHERNNVFLNGCGERFASVAAASGLDLADDGRALATVDWDRDGDLDVWLRNRTGPRLRLMINQAGTTAGDAVSLRLRGTTANRDAVGARAELIDGEGRRSARSVRAGAGFLSQSSAWLHFGLGKAATVDQVTVRWPGGGVEAFTGVEPGGRYLLVQGTGRAEPLPGPGPAPALATAPLAGGAPASGARVRLPLPVPFPAIAYESLSGQPVEVARGGPRLVDLWASWCRPCAEELRELQSRTASLGQAGLQVLALSVDTAEAGGDTGRDGARALLADLGFSLPAGFAGAELLDRIELLQSVLFDRVPAFGVPTSFLLDARGRLAVIYRGAVDVDTVLRDAAAIAAVGSDGRDASLPFPGRWIAPPPSAAAWLRDAAERFHASYPDDALVFLREAIGAAEGAVDASASDDERRRTLGEERETRLLLAGLLDAAGRSEEAVQAYETILASAPDDGEAHHRLGELLARLGRADEALPHLDAAEQAGADDPAVLLDAGRALEAEGRDAEAESSYRRALEIDPLDARGHYLLGALLDRSGRTDDAIASYRRAVQIDPDSVEALTALGVAWSTEGRLRDAIPVFARALEIRPDLFRVALNLGLCHHGLGELEPARSAYERAIALDPSSPEGHFNLGRVLAELGRTTEAVAELHEARRLSPRDPGPPARLAWILATTADDAIRDPEEAVRLGEEAATLAREAARSSGADPDPLALDALAAAYAAAGRFAEATAIGEEAARLADAGGDVTVAAALWKRWKLYRENRAYREPAPRP